MKVAAVELYPVSVPYRHTELSSVVSRDGVTDIVIKMTADDGRVGWGEACSGPDVVSVEHALRTMSPYVIGRDPWRREAIREELFRHALWHLRPMTGNFAFAGLDMALADLCGQASELPLYQLYGGVRRPEVNYFCYLARGSDDELAAQVRAGLDSGYDVFYLKVGLDAEEDVAMVRAVRDALGDGPRLRIDANAAWSIAEAKRNLRRFAEYGIDFCEQPVSESPVELMAELRAATAIPLAANEGLWTEADVYARIAARAQDVLCFSPYWVGSLSGFHRLAHVAAAAGMQTCKHTHGELGIAATAAQHLLITLPGLVDGHQQTATMMEYDLLRTPAPIASGPRWGVPAGPGLGISIDPDALADAAARYQTDGPFLPWRPVAEEL
jgi:L-alanine-DL-glutamate epimerase-like enolase superfamily enzyme